MSKGLIIAMVITILAIGGTATYYVQQQNIDSSVDSTSENEVMSKDEESAVTTKQIESSDDSMKKEDTAMTKEDDAMSQANEVMVKEEDK